jgi:hypothetical protein
MNELNVPVLGSSNHNEHKTKSMSFAKDSCKIEEYGNWKVKRHNTNNVIIQIMTKNVDMGILILTCTHK